MNPFGLLYSEVTASRLVTVDSHGAVIDPGSTQLGINEAGFALHACVHSVRRDVKCVVHVHTTAGVAVRKHCGSVYTNEIPSQNLIITTVCFMDCAIYTLF